MGLFVPKHYLRRLHPKYIPPDILAARVRAGGYANWVNLLKFKNDWALNPELPVLTPWKTTTPINSTTQ